MKFIVEVELYPEGEASPEQIAKQVTESLLEHAFASEEVFRVTASTVASVYVHPGQHGPRRTSSGVGLLFRIETEGKK